MQRKKVYFHIVGYVWPSEMNGTNHVPGFASLIKQYGIRHLTSNEGIRDHAGDRERIR